MYYFAVLHFGLHGKEQVPSFSAFNDSAGFAGCPPSTSYLKGMYTDYIGAHRIYMDRAQAALPLDIAKADHTFDVSPQYQLCLFVLTPITVSQVYGWCKGQKDLEGGLQCGKSVG